MNKQEETLLRNSIRQMIKVVKENKQLSEQTFRNSLTTLAKLELEKMLQEREVADVDPAPNKSTGINVLEELLKKIIPVLETDYKSLTTDNSQRESFRAHIINAVVNTLTPAKVNTAAGEESELAENIEEADMDEEIEIDVGDDAADDKFIDIRTDAEKAAEEEEVEEDPIDDFGAGVEGDETGRNVAYQSFKKIENNIIDAYELLSNEEDQELFYDYLIANLKLYFDKFEGELSSAVDEPTNQAYDMAKSDADAEAGGDELVDTGATLGDEEIALQEFIDSL
mgnify:CR=1 FL=1